MDKNALYYQFPYRKAFDAVVLDCVSCEGLPEPAGPAVASAAAPEKRKGGRKGGSRQAGCDDGHPSPVYAVQLSDHGFYPEGGGQPADRGFIGEARLLDVQEMPDGRILHYVDRPLEPGAGFPCRVDWEWRFRLMQNHTGEHILSGLLHRRFSFENVGFHMAMEGAEPLVTIDMDGAASWEELMEVEEEANRAVYADLPVEILYPEGDALAALDFRSKRALSGDVRIVEIGGGEIDRCACCGLHVAQTGEVGLIKILSAASHRGGLRIEMICGLDAYRHYRMAQRMATEAAQLLSARVAGLPDALRRYQAESAAKDLRISALNQRYYALKAETYIREFPMSPAASSLPSREAGDAPFGTSILCSFEADMQGIELRRFCDYLMKHTGAGIVAVFGGIEGEVGKNGSRKPEGNARTVSGQPSGQAEIAGFGNACTEGECLYQYVLGSLSQDVRPMGKLLNQQFQGRGGGQQGMVQGSVRGCEAEIRSFLNNAALQGSKQQG